MNELKTKNFVEKEEYEEWLNSQSPLVKKKANIYRGLWGDDLPLVVFVEADELNALEQRIAKKKKAREEVKK